MLEDKQKKAVRISCERRYGEWICQQIVVYAKKGIKPSKIAIILEDEISEDSIRRWLEKFKI